MSTPYLRKPSLKDVDLYVGYLKKCAEDQSDNLANDDVLKESYIKWIYEMPLIEQGLLDAMDVPKSSYFLMDDDNHLYGVLSIRHRLNDDYFMYNGHIGYQIHPDYRHQGYGHMMLSLGLKEAVNLGLDQVLITVNEDNVYSIKIIEKHGGILENKVYKTDGYILRYWIDLKGAAHDIY